MPSVEYTEWDFHPQKLNSKETADPEMVIEEFFHYARLPQVRWYLWEMLKTMITGNFPRLNGRERANLVYFYEQLERLIEAVHLLDLRKKQGRA